jgi:CRISPR/Cas system-associated endonuclease/helicase Cas3
MISYALYVCLLHSRFIENHLSDLEAMEPSFLRWFCHSWYQS